MMWELHLNLTTIMNVFASGMLQLPLGFMHDLRESHSGQFKLKSKSDCNACRLRRLKNDVTSLLLWGMKVLIVATASSIVRVRPSVVRKKWLGRWSCLYDRVRGRHGRDSSKAVRFLCNRGKKQRSQSTRADRQHRGDAAQR